MDRQEFYRYLEKHSGQNGFHKMLGIEPQEVKEGYSKVVLNYREELNNPYGAVHGGVIASLIDVVIGIAVVTKIEVGERTVTADLRINYIRGLKGQKGYAIGRLIRKGKNIAVGEAEVYDSEGQLIAKATGTYYIFKIDLDLWQKQVGIDLSQMSQAKTGD